MKTELRGEKGKQSSYMTLDLLWKKEQYLKEHDEFFNNSNSNDDNSDIAGKFSEAIEKLIKWCNESGYDSIAIRKFRELYNGGNVHFPGLGTTKKLSMMNHIELVLKLMN